MQNKSGFVTKNLMQPNYYQKIFDLFCAVYIGNDEKEYHLQISGNIVINRIDGIEILKQEKDGRKYLTPQTFKTIKSAVLYLQEYMTKQKLL